MKLTLFAMIALFSMNSFASYVVPAGCEAAAVAAAKEYIGDNADNFTYEVNSTEGGNAASIRAGGTPLWMWFKFENGQCIVDEVDDCGP